MAKYFYFTRHGQTVWNVENKICGATDIALTDLGHQQAAELGERILKEGIKIDDVQVIVRHGGDLRQMCYADHLRVFRDAAQL